MGIYCPLSVIFPKHIFICQIVPLWPLVVWSDPCIHLTYSSMWGFLSTKITYFLAQDAQGSQVILLFPGLQSVISLRACASFYLNRVLKTKIGVLGVFVATVVLLLGTLSFQSKDTYMHTNQLYMCKYNTYACLYMYYIFYAYMCVYIRVFVYVYAYYLHLYLY